VLATLAPAKTPSAALLELRRKLALKFSNGPRATMRDRALSETPRRAYLERERISVHVFAFVEKSAVARYGETRIRRPALWTFTTLPAAAGQGAEL